MTSRAEWRIRQTVSSSSQSGPVLQVSSIDIARSLRSREMVCLQVIRPVPRLLALTRYLSVHGLLWESVSFHADQMIIQSQTSFLEYYAVRALACHLLR